MSYEENTKLILIAGLALTFGVQNATARQVGIQELTTTLMTSTIVGVGFDSKLAGGGRSPDRLRTALLSQCAAAQLSVRRCPGLPSHR